MSDFTPVISQVYLKITNLYILKSFPSPLDLAQALPSVGAQVGLNPEVWKSQTLWIYSLERETHSLRINGVRWNFLNGSFYSPGIWRMEPKNEGLIQIELSFSKGYFQVPTSNRFWGVYTWDFTKASQGWNLTSSSRGMRHNGITIREDWGFASNPAFFQLFLKLSMLNRPQAGRLLT